MYDSVASATDQTGQRDYSERSMGWSTARPPASARYCRVEGDARMRAEGCQADGLVGLLLGEDTALPTALGYTPLRPRMFALGESSPLGLGELK